MPTLGRDPTKKPDGAKLRELILYIAGRSARDERFGSTKLYKLLFFADFLAYVKLGSSISGQVYQRLPNGPAPKKALPTMKSMIADRDLAIQRRDHFGRTQNVPIALREADLSSFSAREIAVVSEVIEALRSENARDVSSLSHRFSGWKLAADGEPIPYEASLVHFRKPRQEDLELAMSMSDELGSLRSEYPASDAE